LAHGVAALARRPRSPTRIVEALGLSVGVHLAALLVLARAPTPAPAPDERPVELTLLEERPEVTAPKDAGPQPEQEGDEQRPAPEVEDVVPKLPADPEPPPRAEAVTPPPPPPPPVPEEKKETLEFARAQGPEADTPRDDARYFSDRATADERQGRALVAAGAKGAKEAAPRQAGGAAAPASGATAPLESAPPPTPGEVAVEDQDVAEADPLRGQDEPQVEASPPAMPSSEAASQGEVAVAPKPDADWLPIAARVTARSQPEEEAAVAEPSPVPPAAEIEGADEDTETDTVVPGPDEHDPRDPPEDLADVSESARPPPPEPVQPDTVTREGPVDAPLRDDDGLADASDASADSQAEPGAPGTDSAGSIAAPSGASGSRQVLPDDLVIDLQAVAATRDHPLGPWAAEVDGLLEAALDYPPELRAQRLEGRVVVVFTVQRNGRVIDERVLNTSGHSELDVIARLTVPQALPQPRPLKGRTLRVRYTFRFGAEPLGAVDVESP